MNALQTYYALPVIAFASPVYWPDQARLRRVFDELCAELRAGSPAPLDFRLVGNATELAEVALELKGKTAVLLPLSGAVQPWLVELAESLAHAGLANAYLPGFLTPALGAQLLERNAHPACTDFFAHRRLRGRAARWIGQREDLHRYANAHQAVQRLRSARILKIGETEPWVINSTRDPERFRQALGCEVRPLEATELYAAFRRVTDGEASPVADDWTARTTLFMGANHTDVIRAARVIVAMRRLLQEHSADALSMACFAMIGELNTTSCLALSALNDSADAIGACEGDLDAAVTLFLLKALSAGFVWIANPIIHAADCIDLAHCTAPRCVGGERLSYRLLRHHESGRGVSPEVRLPGNRAVTLARIGASLSELCVHPGRALAVAKQPTCHTQIRVHIPSSRRFLECLDGTHVVMTYGDYRPELSCCAELLGIRLTGTSEDEVGSPLTLGPAPVPVCACSAVPAP